MPRVRLRVQRCVRNFIIGTKNINEGSQVLEAEKRGRLEPERVALYAGFEAEGLDAGERLVGLNRLSANYYRINNILSEKGYDLKALSVSRNERIR